MATREIYETTFDEDVQTGTESNECPECNGRVTTNTVETVCEDCRLALDEQQIDHGRGGGRTMTTTVNGRGCR